MKYQNRFPGFIKVILFALALTLHFSACSREGGLSPARTSETARPRARPHGCLDLNTATVEELMRLPNIGEKTARRIIEHREQHGPFGRPEEVIIVEGFSERKYRAIASEVCAQ